MASFTSATAMAAAEVTRVATGSGSARCWASSCASTPATPTVPGRDVIACRPATRCVGRTGRDEHMGMGPAQSVALLVRPAHRRPAGSATSGRARAKRSTVLLPEPPVANAGKARNYGWNRCEGSRRYPATGQRCRFGTRPVHDYGHGAGRCSVTGGYVHRGPAAPAWRGLYIAGDFCGRLFVLGPKGGLKLARDSGLNIASFGEDAAGRLFAADLGGAIHLVRFAGPRP